ncbi:hypothetical protein LTR28_012424 [Elasticomyces elasticus]|nr:hypothetical protein LTR28_012424 [Elasticomyces elasticus]
MSAHAAKIPSWSALFSLSSAQLRESGVEPARARRYLLRMRDRFRQGEYGIGGALKNVSEGVAEVRVVEVPREKRDVGAAAGAAARGVRATLTSSPGMRKVILNPPPGLGASYQPRKVQPVPGLRIVRANTIGGRVQHVKGEGNDVARIVVKEGLWEQRRGHKVDGGERRKAEVRAKRRSEERKMERA